jgi:SAM-dependent methyltransferase
VRIADQTQHPLDRIVAASILDPDELKPIPNVAAPEILVAGCGTGQQAIRIAQRAAGSSVLAVDLSRASLAYARRKSRELGVGNVEYAQADLLELGGLERRFDSIACSGVLHHLDDPEEGLRVLTGLLRPGGVMSLGLYSRTARRILEPAKALARGYEPTPDGIRALRAAILDAPSGDPVRGALHFGDFFTLSSCRDLLMHVHERQFTTAELKALLERTGLRFLGFMVPQDVRAAYVAAYPDDPAGLDLANWGAFEEARPETFAGMYAFWVQKDVA